MNEQPAAPKPPEGMQRPGIPGAGNILDPAVRGEIRQELHPAVHEAAQKARGQNAEKKEENVAEEKQSAPPQQHRSGPYPHGDVDLRFISANVPSEPIRPRRGKSNRKFYFLPESNEASTQTPVAETPEPAKTPPPGPKPG